MKLLERVVRAHDAIVKAARALCWLPPLLARVTLGVVFVESGWGKLGSLDQVADFFTTLGIPAPHLLAPFVASVELVGGALLLLGLGTRVAALFIGFVMAVALITAKAEELKSLSDGFGTIEFLYLVLCVFLLVEGAGALSLDRLWTRLIVLRAQTSAKRPAIG